jgi:hypothetical protein
MDIDHSCYGEGGGHVLSVESDSDSNPIRIWTCISNWLGCRMNGRGDL